MKKLIKKIIKIFLSPFIFFDYLKFKKGNDRFSIKLSDFYPCIKDKTIKTNFDAHYVYHTSWAARKVKEINPIGILNVLGLINPVHVHTKMTAFRVHPNPDICLEPIDVATEIKNLCAMTESRYIDIDYKRKD